MLGKSPFGYVSNIVSHPTTIFEKFLIFQKLFFEIFIKNFKKIFLLFRCAQNAKKKKFFISFANAQEIKKKKFFLFCCAK